ncbi:hypothetical protein [Ottowia thiooxydans]|uniref:hypothetical protein n=1 Tax=Ottowia thiooxydans TaxID=219182 RepID=UPI0012EB30F6|nr:hypothetical protein [Ottowia thiooxydans]
MKCPKCQYERKPSDEAPEYECPSCGIIYAKYNPISHKAPIKPLPTVKSDGLLQKFVASKFGKFLLWSFAGIAFLTLIAQLLGGEYALLGGFAIVGLWAVSKAIEGSQKQAEQRQAEMEKQPYLHCMTCGHDFKTYKSALRGSNTMEIALWVLLMWPIALVYSIWRRLGAGKAKISCIVCASNQVVPETSPAAIAHKKALGIKD